MIVKFAVFENNSDKKGAKRVIGQLKAGGPTTRRCGVRYLSVRYLRILDVRKASETTVLDLSRSLLLASSKVQTITVPPCSSLWTTSKMPFTLRLNGIWTIHILR